MTPRSFKLRHKALLPVILLTAMSAVYISFSLYALYSQHRATLELAAQVHEIQRLSDLILRIQDLARPLLVQVSGKQASATTEFDATTREVELLINSLHDLSTLDSAEGRMLAETQARLTEIRRLAQTRVLRNSAGHAQQLAALEQLMSGPLLELCRKLLAWHEDELRQTEAIRAQAQSDLTLLLIETGVLSLLAGMLLAGALWYYERLLVQPLLALGRSTAILASGDLKHRITLDTGDEIGQLAGDINRMAGALNALTERLSQAAEHDALTGLLNRRAFGTIVERELALAEETQRPCSLALLDIDHFKMVNDTYGHAPGDAVLRHIASLCQQSIRNGDYCFRYGGEELVILMPSTTLEQALITLERTRNAIETTPFPVDAKPLRVTVSYGVAVSPEDGKQRELLVQHADDALYHAKETGRNRGVAFRNMNKG